MHKYIYIKKKRTILGLASRAQNLAQSSSNRFPRGSKCTVHRDVPFRHHVSDIIITRLRRSRTYIA